MDLKALFGDFSPLLILGMIVGLTEFAKKFGVVGNAAIACSMLLGILFAILYQIGQLNPAVDMWLQIVVFGILFGLTACGFYDLGKKFLAPKE